MAPLDFLTMATSLHSIIQRLHLHRASGLLAPRRRLLPGCLVAPLAHRRQQHRRLRHPELQRQLFRSGISRHRRAVASDLLPAQAARHAPLRIAPWPQRHGLIHRRRDLRRRWKRPSALTITSRRRHRHVSDSRRSSRSRSIVSSIMSSSTPRPQVGRAAALPRAVPVVEVAPSKPRRALAAPSAATDTVAAATKRSSGGSMRRTPW